MQIARNWFSGFINNTGVMFEIMFGRCINFFGVPDLFQHIKCCPCLVSTVCFSLLLLYTAQTRKRLNFPQFPAPSFVNDPSVVALIFRIFVFLSLSFSVTCIEAWCRLDAFSCIWRWLLVWKKLKIISKIQGRPTGPLSVLHPIFFWFVTALMIQYITKRNRKGDKRDACLTPPFTSNVFC